MNRTAIMAAALAVSMLGSRPAGADAGPHISSGWYLPVGLNLGAAIHPKVHHGFLIGAEVSFAHLDVARFLWIGGYVDALYDFGAKATRFSIGPEIGWSLVGIDFGYMGDVRRGEYHHGIDLRVLLTLSMVAIYGRWGHVFGLDRESDFGEVGVLLKAPIPLKVDPYEPHLPPRAEDEPPAGDQDEGDGSDIDDPMPADPVEPG
jgi:hypothetical protein